MANLRSVLLSLGLCCTHVASWTSPAVLAGRAMSRLNVAKAVRDSLALAPSPFAVSQSFSPAVFDETFTEAEPLANAAEEDESSRLFIWVPADTDRLTSFVLAAVHLEPSITVSFVKSTREGLRLVAYGSTCALKSIVQTLSKHTDDGLSIKWQNV